MSTNSDYKRSLNNDANLQEEDEEDEAFPLNPINGKESSLTELKPEEPMEEVESFSDIVGNSGPYQRDILLLYISIYLIAAFQNYGITFYSETPEYWCKSEENQSLTNLVSKSNRTTCQVSPSDNSTCHEWEFDHSFYRSTIVTEFYLVCDRSLYVSYSKSIYQIGYLISSILFGWISDRHGRKLAFRLAIILELISGLSQALAPNVYIFLISRLFLGIAAFSRFLTGMIILVEWAGPNKRARIRMLLEMGWSGGYFLLPIVFYFVRDFRYTQLGVFFYELILLYPLMTKFPESPQWLLVKGKFDEATELLTEAIIKNKKGTREDVVRKLAVLEKKFLEEAKSREEEANKTIIDLWKVPRLLKFSLAQYVIWFSGAFVSYGVTYNAGDFGGSLYINFIGFAVIDTLNNIAMYFIVDRFKRRTLFLSFAFITATMLLAMVPISFEKDGFLALRITLLMLGKFASNGMFHLIYLLAAEIYPTSVRHIGVGSCSVAARFGSVAAPFIRELTEATNLATTFALFATLSLIAGGLGFLLPETKDQPIPDTLKQAERRKSTIA